LVKIKNLMSQLATTNPRKLWPEAAASLVLGLGVSAIPYAIALREQTYTHFVAGYSTWLGLGKQSDYLLLVTFLVTSPIIFLLLFRLRLLFGQRFGRKFAEDFTTSIKWSLVPFVFWLLNLLVSPEIRLFFPVLGSALLLSTVLQAAFFVKYFRHRTNDSSISYLSSWSTLWKIFGAIAASTFGAFTLLSRLDLPSLGFVSPQVLSVASIALFSLTATSVASITALRHFRGSMKKENVGATIRLLSLGSPFLLLVLVPEKMEAPGGNVSFIQIQPSFSLALIVLIITVGLSIILPDNVQLGKTQLRIGKAFRALQLVPILTFLKTPNTDLPRLGTDDYHIGEFTVPGFLLSEPGLVVYESHDPARGFVNFIPGITSRFFLDGSYSSYEYAFPIIYTFILVLIIPILSRVLQPSILLLGLMSFPAANLLSPEIDLLSVTFVLLISWLLYQKKEIFALSTIIVAAPGLLIFAPGQFALSFVALIPSIVISLWRNRLTLSRFLCAPIIVSLGLSTLFVVTFMETFLGAIRYGQEQSSSNTEAYGVPWLVSSLSAPQINVVLFELVRSGWILIPVIILMTLPWAVRKKALREKALFFLIPILFFTLTSVFRAAGRIDPGFLSRLGQVSAIAAAILVPVILFFVLRSKLNPASVSLFLVPIAILGPLTGNSVSSGAVEKNALDHFNRIQITNVELENAQQTARTFPRIGEAVIEKDQKERLQEIQAVLEQFNVMSRDFLDLSDRSATYAYLGYVPPIASGAVYNLSSYGQQKRAVSALKSRPPKAILLSADNIPHDGGPISTRTPILFGHLLRSLDEYFVIEYRLSTWLISRDKEDLRKEGIGKLLEGDQARRKLADTWGLKDFLGLPAAWGNSAPTLETKIHWGYPGNATGEITSEGEFSTEVFSLEKIAALDAFFEQKLVLLQVDVSCRVQSLNLRQYVLGWQISINDSSSESQIAVFRVKEGTNLIPLYASEYWLSANTPTFENKLIDLSGAPCSSNSIKNVKVGVIKVP
jgi:hypothetical protein